MKHGLTRGRATHADRLERWLGKEQVEDISQHMRNFYYPVPLHGVPGKVYAMPGGDFAGEIVAGQFASKHDGAATVLRKLRNRLDAKARQSKAAGTLIDLIRAEDKRMASVGAFASIDAVVAAATGGKGQAMTFYKTGAAAGSIGMSTDLWTRAGQPVAGAAAAAAPGGTVPTSATTGAMPFKNLGAANSGHYLNWTVTANVVANSLLLYDRIFAVAKTMNSTAAEVVSGVPTRYQNTAATAVDYIGGNFCFPANPTTVLPATAHNWTVCQYTDDTNTTGQSFQSTAGQPSCPVGNIDIASGTSWFMGLATGDVGVRNITQIQCSAAVATGTIEFVIGHPIAINACPVANLACLDDGLYTSLNLTPILDSACLSFIELPKPATTATTYSGLLRTVSE